MKILILAAAMAVLAAPAIAGDAKTPKIDRAAALARAPQFHDQVEAALTQKPNALYLAALTGSANDRWVWGLALVAERYDTASVPAPILATFQAYSAKVDAARDAYQKKHPKADTSEKPMSFFVEPTPEEAQATQLVQTINSSAGWLEQARRGGIDGALLDQSVRCLDSVKGTVDAENLMMQLVSAVGPAAEDTKKGGNSGGAKEDAVDLAALLSMPKDEADKSDEERDEEALCGGGDAFLHVKTLMKAVYTSPIRVTVSTDKKK